MELQTPDQGGPYTGLRGFVFEPQAHYSLFRFQNQIVSFREFKPGRTGEETNLIQQQVENFFKFLENSERKKYLQQQRNQQCQEAAPSIFSNFRHPLKATERQNHQAEYISI